MRCPLVMHGNAVAARYVDFLFDAASQPDGVTRYADLAGNQLVAQTDYVFDHDQRNCIGRCERLVSRYPC